MTGPQRAYTGPPLPFSAHRAFYSLYRELAKVGIGPIVAKTMEAWEAAAALGVGTTTDSTPAAQRASGSKASHDLLRQRLAASQGLAPPPQASAPNPDEVAAMISAFATAPR